MPLPKGRIMDVPPHSGYLRDEDYESLDNEKKVNLEDGREISFTDVSQFSIESISRNGEISFTYLNEDLSIKIGKKTPLFDVIKNCSGKDQELGIKVLVLKYIIALLNVHEVGKNGIKEITAEFDHNRQCIAVLSGKKDISTRKRTVQGKTRKKTRTVQENLTRLADPEKVQKIFMKTVQKKSLKIKPPSRKRVIPKEESAVQNESEDVCYEKRKNKVTISPPSAVEKDFKGQAKLVHKELKGLLKKIKSRGPSENLQAIVPDLENFFKKFNKKHGTKLGAMTAESHGGDLDSWQTFKLVDRAVGEAGKESPILKELNDLLYEKYGLLGNDRALSGGLEKKRTSSSFLQSNELMYPQIQLTRVDAHKILNLIDTNTYREVIQENPPPFLEFRPIKAPLVQEEVQDIREGAVVGNREEQFYHEVKTIFVDLKNYMNSMGVDITRENFPEGSTIDPFMYRIFECVNPSNKQPENEVIPKLIELIKQEIVSMMTQTDEYQEGLANCFEDERIPYIKRREEECRADLTNESILGRFKSSVERIKGPKLSNRLKLTKNWDAVSDCFWQNYVDPDQSFDENWRQFRAKLKDFQECEIDLTRKMLLHEIEGINLQGIDMDSFNEKIFSFIQEADEFPQHSIDPARFEHFFKEEVVDVMDRGGIVTLKTLEKFLRYCCKKDPLIKKQRGLGFSTFGGIREANISMRELFSEV